MVPLTCYWPRAIIHIDMNAFFALVEQRDFLELRGKPIGVTNGEVGTTFRTERLDGISGYASDLVRRGPKIKKG